MTVVCLKVSKAFTPLKTSRVSRPMGIFGVFSHAGFTLVEVMIAVAIIGIAVIGALDYQYYAAKHSRIAKIQTTVTRTAQLLMEDWKSVGGATNYNPAALSLGFSSGTVPSGFTMGESYGAVINNSVYFVTVDHIPMVLILCWSDVDHDTIAGTTLRQLTAMVRWRMDDTTLCNFPIILTTYVRLDD